MSHGMKMEHPRQSSSDFAPPWQHATRWDAFGTQSYDTRKKNMLVLPLPRTTHSHLLLHLHYTSLWNVLLKKPLVHYEWVTVEGKQSTTAS